MWVFLPQVLFLKLRGQQNSNSFWLWLYSVETVQMPWLYGEDNNVTFDNAHIVQGWKKILTSAGVNFGKGQSQAEFFLFLLHRMLLFRKKWELANLEMEVYI